MAELEGVGAATAQVKRKTRGPNQGSPDSLQNILRRDLWVGYHDRALLKARADRAAAVKDALAAGWSVRGLAQALGVDKSWVQRAMGQD